MLFDFGRLIGGPGQGDGLMGWFLNLFTGAAAAGAGGAGIFDAVGGAEAGTAAAGWGAAGDVLGGTAGRAGMASEGLFARLFAFLEDVTYSYWDYRVWTDVMGGQGTQDYFKNADAAINGPARDLREVIQGHSFMLQQLRDHQAKPGMADLLKEYEALELNLPSEDLTKRTWKALARHLHTGHRPGDDDALMKLLNGAHDALENEAKRGIYNDALRKNPEALKTLFTEIGKVDWKQTAAKASEELKLLEGSGAKATNGARKWFAELTPTQRGGLIFGTVMGVGIGGYYVLHKLDQRRHKKAHQLPDPIPANPHSRKIIERTLHHNPPDMVGQAVTG